MTSETHESPMERPTPAVHRGLSPARKAAVAGLILVILVASVGLFTLDGNDDAPAAAPGGELSEFHQIEIVTLDGQVAAFDTLVGQPVVLNFFASWCGPCVAEMPTLEGLHQDLGGELAIVGLAIEGARPASEIVEQTGVTYLTGLDEDGVLLERFDGFGMPTTVFIDAEGNVVDTHIGELTDGAFRDRIRDHFGIGDA